MAARGLCYETPERVLNANRHLQVKVFATNPLDASGGYKFVGRFPMRYMGSVPSVRVEGVGYVPVESVALKGQENAAFLVTHPEYTKELLRRHEEAVRKRQKFPDAT